MELETRQTSLHPPEDSTDVIAVIDGVLEAANDATEPDRALVSAAREAEDSVTADLAVTLPADGEAHRREFRWFRMEYDD